jgi:CheY-like chemotaxis protein
MIRSRSKIVLLVAPKAFPDQLLAAYENVKHVFAVSTIFPVVHALKPDVILFDHEHLGKDMEQVIRRLRTNPFYKKVKLLIYKEQEDAKADALLKALGVNHIIYRHDLQPAAKPEPAPNAINNLINASLIRLVAGMAQ